MPTPPAITRAPVVVLVELVVVLNTDGPVTVKLVVVILPAAMPPFAWPPAPLNVKFPPIVKSFPIPTPPATTTAPVSVLVELVVDATNICVVACKFVNVADLGTLLPMTILSIVPTFPPLITTVPVPVGAMLTLLLTGFIVTEPSTLNAPVTVNEFTLKFVAVKSVNCPVPGWVTPMFVFSIFLL